MQKFRQIDLSYSKGICFDEIFFKVSSIFQTVHSNFRPLLLD